MNKLPYFVAIGASGAEGLSDIVSLLNLWPKEVNAVLIVVLHRSSEKPSSLIEVLLRQCRGMALDVAHAGQRLVPGTTYIGPPDRPLTVLDDGSAYLIDGSRERLRNQTIDVLFESIAANIGKRSVGIVLSGSLHDGSRGLAAIHHAGGLTFVGSRRQAVGNATKRN
ncbi:chemotaxis protein CheB [Caballeronia sp.]|uniref:chemotaxis protein CheB n=1 Tax=Caballeronia sp. TaxID=1931223 RepID=UPI00262EA5C8|nr:chemotaxis protein CheB [Caballeronia sp.]